MKSLLIILLLITASLTYAQAKDYHWEFSGWYGGGCYPNVEFDPNVKNRVYLTSDVTGIWRSDDLGEHWRFINKGLGHLIVAQVAVAPLDSNVLYAATGGGVFYSLNAGESWLKANDVDKKISFKRPANYRSVAIDPTNAAHVCVGTAKGEIYCSANHGASWLNIALAENFLVEDKPIAAVQFSEDGGSLIVAFSQAVAKYDLKNSSWKILGRFEDVSDALLDWQSGIIFVTNKNKISFKKESDKDWVVSSPIPEGNAYRIALAEGKIYVGWLKGWNGGVVVSEDNGHSWGNLNKNLQANIRLDPTRAWAQKATKLTSLKINPFDSKVIFRSDYWGVWRSDTSGQVWDEKINGAPNTVGTDLAMDRHGNIFAATMDNGLLKSVNAGKSYSSLFPKDRYKDDENGHIWAVVVTSKGDIVATSSPWNKEINQVIVSRDGGKTFKLIRDGLPQGRPRQNTMWGQGYPRALAVDPSDPMRLYLGIDGDDGGGLFISLDGGDTWQRSSGQPDSLRIYHGLAIDPTNPNVVVWGSTAKAGGVYISKDKGARFTQVFKEMSWVFRVVIDANGKIYAGGDSSGPALYMAASSNKPFRLLKRFTDGAGKAIDGIAIHPKNPKIIAVSTVNWGNGSPCEYYLSRDSGKTWETINGDLSEGSGASDMIFDASGDYLYISRYAGSVYRLRI